MSTPAIDLRLRLSVDEAARALGVSRETFYRLMRCGAVKTVKVGRLRKVRRQDLEDYVAHLNTEVA